MTSAFASFINNTVIPKNWHTLSHRMNIESYSFAKQRMKIIGEIVEFHEAMENYRKAPRNENIEAIHLELADVIISCCTLIRLQGSERRYYYAEIHESDPLEWIRLVYNRDTNTLISAAAIFGKTLGIPLEETILRKLDYNEKRKDWK